MSKMRLSLKIGKARRRKPLSLDDLLPGASGVLARFEMAEADATRLIGLWFLPGARIDAGWSAPNGNPRVFRVDRTEFALRHDTARRLLVEVAIKGVA